MRIPEIAPSHIANAMGIREGVAWAMACNIERCYKPRRWQLIGKKCRPIDPLYPKAAKHMNIPWKMLAARPEQNALLLQCLLEEGNNIERGCELFADRHYV